MSHREINMPSGMFSQIHTEILTTQSDENVHNGIDPLFDGSKLEPDYKAEDSNVLITTPLLPGNNQNTSSASTETVKNENPDQDKVTTCIISSNLTDGKEVFPSLCKEKDGGNTAVEIQEKAAFMRNVHQPDPNKCLSEAEQVTVVETAPTEEVQIDKLVIQSVPSDTKQNSTEGDESTEERTVAPTNKKNCDPCNNNINPIYYENASLCNTSETTNSSIILDEVFVKESKSNCSLTITPIKTPNLESTSTEFPIAVVRKSFEFPRTPEKHKPSSSSISLETSSANDINITNSEITSKTSVSTSSETEPLITCCHHRTLSQFPPHTNGSCLMRDNDTLGTATVRIKLQNSPKHISIPVRFLHPIKNINAGSKISDTNVFSQTNKSDQNPQKKFIPTILLRTNKNQGKDEAKFPIVTKIVEMPVGVKNKITPKPSYMPVYKKMQPNCGTAISNIGREIYKLHQTPGRTLITSVLISSPLHMTTSNDSVVYSTSPLPAYNISPVASNYHTSSSATDQVMENCDLQFARSTSIKTSTPTSTKTCNLEDVKQIENSFQSRKPNQSVISFQQRLNETEDNSVTIIKIKNKSHEINMENKEDQKQLTAINRENISITITPTKKNALINKKEIANEDKLQSDEEYKETTDTAYNNQRRSRGRPGNRGRITSSYKLTNEVKNTNSLPVSGKPKSLYFESFIVDKDGLKIPGRGRGRPKGSKMKVGRTAVLLSTKTPTTSENEIPRKKRKYTKRKSVINLSEQTKKSDTHSVNCQEYNNFKSGELTNIIYDSFPTCKQYEPPQFQNARLNEHEDDEMKYETVTNILEGIGNHSTSNHQMSRGMPINISDAQEVSYNMNNDGNGFHSANNGTASFCYNQTPASCNNSMYMNNNTQGIYNNTDDSYIIPETTASAFACTSNVPVNSDLGLTNYGNAITYMNPYENFDTGASVNLKMENKGHDISNMWPFYQEGFITNNNYDNNIHQSINVQSHDELQNNYQLPPATLNFNKQQELISNGNEPNFGAYSNIPNNSFNSEEVQSFENTTNDRELYNFVNCDTNNIGQYDEIINVPVPVSFNSRGTGRGRGRGGGGGRCKPDKPYVCPICGTCEQYSVLLDRHLRLYHGHQLGYAPY